jgi:hypothetical protein
MLPYPENSLDFMSAKVQSEEDRNANAKRSGFPFQNLIDGTRSSVPRRSLRRRSGQWNSRERPSRVGGRYGDCNRKSDAGCGTPSRCRYMPVTRIPANSDQNRRAEYLSRSSGATGSRVCEPPERSLLERSPGHRRKIETNMAVRAKHPERLRFRLDLRPARWRGGRRPVETSCDARQEP